VVLVVSALWGLVVVDAGAEVPAGPRLTFMRANGARLELISGDSAGEDQRLIAGGGELAGPLPNPFSPPAWSPDGTHLVFSGVSRVESKEQLNLYEAAADGSGLTKLPGTVGASDPVLSQDGRTLAFAVERQRHAMGPHGGEMTVFRSGSIWLLDLGSGAVRRLSPWRNELFEFPSSFSPDGTTLATFRRLDRSGRPSRYASFAMRLDGSGSTLLARGAGEPVYSPDGSRVALIAVGRTRTFATTRGSTTITYTDLAVANADGSGLTKLTNSKAIEVKPSWDPSGQRLAYTQIPATPSDGDLLGFGDSIMEINADGRCRTRVLSYPTALLYGATWQPGPGREAGPIVC
jgi:Tol biopolymer transport system component